MALDEELPCVHHVPLNEGAVGKLLLECGTVLGQNFGQPYFSKPPLDVFIYNAILVPENLY